LKPTDTDLTPCEASGMELSADDAVAIGNRQDERYHIIADAVPQIVWAADPDGGRDYFNQRWYEHTGFGPSEATGWSWLGVLHDEDRARCREAWMRCVTQQDNFEIEYRLRCADDGSYRWVIERALPVFDPQGEIIKWYGTCTDIDDLKKAQSEIEDLNVRLRRAMTETHHRVKNNLQIISAMVDMQLLNDEATISAEEFRRLGSHVRTLAAVHDILTKESKETGSSQTISLPEVLDQLIPIHQQTAPNCSITANIENVLLSGRQGTSLALVINELISNAIKHGRGRVEIVVTQLPTGTSVTVCDDGPGFPDDFDSVAAANTGLELVDSLVKWDLAGRVEYGNQPGGGGRVTLDLPGPAPTNGSRSTP
jgi:PAS domain S-box-containing protein